MLSRPQRPEANGVRGASGREASQRHPHPYGCGTVPVRWGGGRLSPASRVGPRCGEQFEQVEKVVEGPAQGRPAIHLPGRPEWVFVKVHTHGAADRNLAGLLGGGFEALFSDLERRYNDGRRWRLHYVTARELYNIIKAAEAGHTGDPSDYRNFAIAPPGARIAALT